MSTTIPAPDNLAIVRGMFSQLIEAGRVDDDSVARYIAPDYRQRVDGHELDLAGFKRHLRAQREVVEKMEVYFLAVAQDHDCVLTHHRVRVTKKDGKTALFQVQAHITLRGGRITACDELTRQLAGPAADRDLGSRQ
ncbi:nuclear transport factor 2 family protein [Chromobacterium sp. CV08]|uniref:nuclear transport factor 2 family protein n=1 Tax=Chromobacterium sp. CV08 TaxID=3133274 RepID=UPI003DA9532E